MSVDTKRLGDAATASAALSLAESLRHFRSGRGARRYTRESTVRRLLLVTDAVALTISFAVIEFWGGFHGGQTSTAVRDFALLAFGVPVWILLAQAHNLYHADTRHADHGWTDELMPIIQMATLWSWTILLGISLTGIRPVTIPKLAVFWALTIVLLLTLRSGTRYWARRRDWYVQNVLAIGPAEKTATVVRRVLRHPEYRLNVVACVDTVGGPLLDSTTESFIARSIGRVPMIRGEATVLPELIDELEIDRIMFAPGARDTREGSEAFGLLAELDVHIDLIPSWSDAVGRRLDFHELEGMPLLTVPRTVIRRSDQFRKRLFDIFVTTGALFLLSPVLLLCAIAIKLDSPGPILFRQRRVGKDDGRFEVLKFRSMEANAEAQKQGLAALNLHGGGTVTGMFKVRDDPRVTRVGRWLRRTSLDELPQLINVLRGDMSLVGPRPLIENEDRQVEGRFRRRLLSSPGLTGPWQIHGRSDIPFEDMISLDYFYVTSWSLWGDVKLMLRTVHAIARGNGAY